MGYACPVCDVPQRDAEHLANHLAFTAMLHGGEHEAWLDDHVPEWAAGSPDDLAPVVADVAEDAHYEEVFEDTVPADRGRPDVGALGEGTHGHDHSHGHSQDHADGHARGDRPDAALDDDARRVLREAREMTEAMLAAEADEEGGEATDDEDGASDDRPDRDGKA